jgi:hypothetical protein
MGVRTATAVPYDEHRVRPAGAPAREDTPVTAPQDPFRSPEPGQPPHQDGASPESPRSAPGYGAAAPGTAPGQYGAEQYGSTQYGSPQYGAPGHGAAPYGSAPRREPRNGLGIAALVLGILALLTGLFVVGAAFGLAAIVLGILGRSRAKRGEATNGGMALAGIILGVLGLLLTVLVLVGVASLFDSEQFGNLADCLESAGSDPAAQQQCQADFEEDVVGG